jgi:hypothetical protein
MRLAIKSPNNFSKVISFMPAYGEQPEYKDELKSLKVKTMILWVSKDAMHAWSKFKPFADKIPGAVIHSHSTP